MDSIWTILCKGTQITPTSSKQIETILRTRQINSQRLEALIYYCKNHMHLNYLWNVLGVKALSFLLATLYLL